MWRKSGYVEIPAHLDVRRFLDSSESYQQLVRIPHAKLNIANQKTFYDLCDPLSFADLRDVFHKTSASQPKSGITLFLGSFVDENDNFEYYLLHLKMEFEALTTEKSPLLTL